MQNAVKNKDQAVKLLNAALAWELRVVIMYSHFAAYLTGRDRLDFEEHFLGEWKESTDHAQKVRQIIADIGGEATTTPDPAPIPTPASADEMLAEALRSEEKAEQCYREALAQFEHVTYWHHEVRHILMEEEAAQIEIKRWIKGA